MTADTRVRGRDAVRIIGGILAPAREPETGTYPACIKSLMAGCVRVLPSPVKNGAARDGRRIGADGVASGKNRRAMLRAAVAAARKLRGTHLWVIDPAGRIDIDDGRRLTAAAEKNPGAVIIGQKVIGPPERPVGRRLRRRVAAGLFRLQSGIDLTDPASPVRIYPLWLFDCLSIRSRGRTVDTEILVKTAWAGVPILPVLLESPGGMPRQVRMNFSRLMAGMAAIALNVHWTMRSITPVPHRKIGADRCRPERKISVRHPLRSIRKLLTENVTPGRLGGAAALGVFLGALPLIACHTIAILLAAGFFRLNKPAALAASQLCMPPVVPALCIETGFFLRHGRFLTELSLNTLGHQALERVWEWLLGALLVAPVLALAVGGIVYGAGWMIRHQQGRFS